MKRKDQVKGEIPLGIKKKKKKKRAYHNLSSSVKNPGVNIWKSCFEGDGDD